MVDQAHSARLLEEYQSGEIGLDELFPVVYDELRLIAHRRMKGEYRAHTFCTTELVHECYLNLSGRTRNSWENRAHFLALASKAMRHILIDYARRRQAQKRGGNFKRITIEDNLMSVEQQTAEIISIDQALSELEKRHERMAAVVERRFFGGMTVRETADSLNVSVRTVEQDWTRAKAHLRRALANQQDDS